MSLRRQVAVSLARSTLAVVNCLTLAGARAIQGVDLALGLVGHALSHEAERLADEMKKDCAAHEARMRSTSKAVN